MEVDPRAARRLILQHSTQFGGQDQSDRPIRFTCLSMRQLFGSIPDFTDIELLLSGSQDRTIAEGVETPNQRDRLVEAECDILQGYHFSRPLPLEAFIAFCREYSA